MVGKYIRKTNRQSWDEETLIKAIEAVTEKKMGWLKAAKKYGIPQATLRRRALDKDKNVSKGLGRYKTTFNSAAELELVKHIQLLETRQFGLTGKELRQLAFEFAERNGIIHRFDTENKIAGSDWLRGFRNRHPKISLRITETSSASKATAFNKVRVSSFFNCLNVLLKNYDIALTRIFNASEMDLSTFQKPVATKINSANAKNEFTELGVNVMAICCMSPIGNFVPPALVFPRDDYFEYLLKGAPLGSLGISQRSGTVANETFLKWLKHFASFVCASNLNKVLLLLDEHSSHKCLDVLTFAEDNGIVIIGIPPNCSHRMQPLDISFYGPLKTLYQQESSLWVENHPGYVVAQNQVAHVFGRAYEKAATMFNAVSGFHSTGICPYNSNIFPDYLFANAPTTSNDDMDILQLLEMKIQGNADNKGQLHIEDAYKQEEICL